ncbi:hypothetical protein BD560DRAFT_212665 [Blakeslea trispora]|nr:hypothetical protein BD560DRAFT_212665 [Blakeslea trispora]
MPQAMSTRDLFEQEKLVNHSRLYHYPLLHHPDLVSERALSVLTLYHLSLVCIQLDYEANMQDIAKRLMLNISEGLIDMTSQQQFQRMLTQQPKSRVAGWKKKVKSGELGTVMKMRPCLVPEESYLLMPLLSQLKQMDDLVEALETKPISSPAAGILYFA